ncbi:MAG: ferritin [Holosporaceae bacterium]|jgi:ferritin|nr:ferritin [Holosporaceae bacterium]
MAVGLGKKVAELLNKQVSEEFAAGYLHIAMSAVLKEMNLDGCANWAMIRAKECERQAMEFFHYIQERGAKIKLQPINPARQDWRAPLHVFEDMMRQEQRNGAMINVIYEASVSEKDYATQNFISQFVLKQAKQATKAFNLLEQLRKMQTTDIGVIMFDAELERKIEPPR